MSSDPDSQTPDQPPWLEDVLGPILKDGEGNQVEPRTAALYFVGASVVYDPVYKVRRIVVGTGGSGGLPAIGPANSLLRSNGTDPVYTMMNAAMHGQQTNELLHAVATAEANGFMSKAQATQLANLVAAAASTIFEGDTRLTNARTPTTHSASHTTGADQLSDASDTVHGLMTAAEHVKLLGITAGASRKAVHSVTSIPAMQLISTAQLGDICTVSIASPKSDTQFTFVDAGKYSYGVNCYSGIGGDWYAEIDRMATRVQLTAGYYFWYIPGIPSDSVPLVSRETLVGDPGDLSAKVIANGIEVTSQGPGDASYVNVHVLLGAA